jgi:hypothetical protein
MLVRRVDAEISIGSGSLQIRLAHRKGAGCPRPHEGRARLLRGCDVIGVEVLYFGSVAGKRALEGLRESRDDETSRLKLSYDAEADAFYLDMRGLMTADQQRSRRQQVVDARLILDAQGTLTALDLQVPRSSMAGTE